MTCSTSPESQEIKCSCDSFRSIRIRLSPMWWRFAVPRRDPKDCTYISICEQRVFTVSVRDSGIGIEPEVMQRIFDPFEQGNRSFEHRFGGLGLGLAISKSLAQANGGTLTAQSEGRDRGSTFIFSMPTLSPAEIPT